MAQQGEAPTVDLDEMLARQIMESPDSNEKAKEWAQHILRPAMTQEALQEALAALERQIERLPERYQDTIYWAAVQALRAQEASNCARVILKAERIRATLSRR